MDAQRKVALDKILLQLADDYETIWSLTQGTVEEYRLKLSREELLIGLGELITMGLVKAVAFNQQTKVFETLEILSDDIDEHEVLFGLTRKGKEYLAEQS